MSVGKNAIHDPAAAARARPSAPPGSPTSRPTSRRSSPRPTSTRRRSRRSTSASTSSRRCSPSSVDATLGAFWNVEGIQLAAREEGPDDHPHRQGRRADLQRAGDRRRAPRTCATGASASGASCTPSPSATRRCSKDPSVGIDPLLKANRTSTAADTTASVKATLPAFFPGGGKPFGYMDPVAWRAYGDWMLQNKLIKLPAEPQPRADERVPARRGAGRDEYAVARPRSERVGAGQAGPAVVGGEEGADLVLGRARPCGARSAARPTSFR